MAEIADQAFMSTQHIQKATNCNNIKIQMVASVDMDVGGFICKYSGCLSGTLKYLNNLSVLRS